MAILEDLIRDLNGLKEGMSVCISGKVVIRKIPETLSEGEGKDDSPNRLFEYETMFDVKRTGEKSYEISDVKGEFAMSLEGTTRWVFLKENKFVCAIAKSMKCQKPEEYQKLIDEKKPDQVMIYPA